MMMVADMANSTIAIRALSIVLMWVAEGTEARRQRRRDLLDMFCRLHTEDVQRLQTKQYVFIPEEEDYYGYDWDIIDDYNIHNHYDTWDNDLTDW